jgi:hypothetical protein
MLLLSVAAITAGVPLRPGTMLLLSVHCVHSTLCAYTTHGLSSPRDGVYGALSTVCHVLVHCVHILHTDCCCCPCTVCIVHCVHILHTERPSAAPEMAATDSSSMVPSQPGYP